MMIGTTRTLFAIIGVTLLLLTACGNPDTAGGPTASPSATVAGTRPAPAPPSSVAATPGTDFAFIFDEGTCGIGRLDTASGTFARRIVHTEPDVVVPLVLTAEERATVYRKMVEIGFFDYPEGFKVTPGPGSPMAMMAPSITYRFTVRDGARAKELTWTDNFPGPEGAEAKRLRELITLIEQIIQARPEYKQLPQRQYGCV